MEKSGGAKSIKTGAGEKTEIVASEASVAVPSLDKRDDKPVIKVGNSLSAGSVVNVSSMWNLVKVVVLAAVFTVFLAGVGMVISN